jgi:Family of unknown function (DUF6433)
MSSLTIAEICDKLQSAKTKTERIEILKRNDTPALRGILRMNYDHSLVLALPEGTPPYKKSVRPVGFGDSTLKTSCRGWYVFVKEAAPEMKQSKRESLFISLLESLDPKEAEILLGAKDRKLDLGLTKKVIDEVFPGLIRSEGKSNGKKEQSTKTARSASADKGAREVSRADSDV